jgi:hypothetical protein
VCGNSTHGVFDVLRGWFDDRRTSLEIFLRSFKHHIDFQHECVNDGRNCRSFASERLHDSLDCLIQLFGVAAPCVRFGEIADNF